MKNSRHQRKNVLRKSYRQALKSQARGKKLISTETEYDTIPEERERVHERKFFPKLKKHLGKDRYIKSGQ